VMLGVVGRCLKDMNRVASNTASRAMLGTVTPAAFTSGKLGKTVHFIRHGTAVHNVRYNRREEVFRALIDMRSKTEADRVDRWLFPEIEEWAYMTNETIDTALVEEGVQEAISLGSQWASGSAFLYDRGGRTARPVPLAMHNVDLIVTSPLTRTLQTTLNIFFRQELSGSGREVLVPMSRLDSGMVPTPIIALDTIKEWSQGRHTPNQRKSRSLLTRLYPTISFDHLDTEEDTMWREFWPGAELGLEPLSHLRSRVAQFIEWLARRPEQNVVVVSHGTFLGNLLYGTFIEDTAELAHCQVYSARV